MLPDTSILSWLHINTLYNGPNSKSTLFSRYGAGAGPGFLLPLDANDEAVAWIFFGEVTSSPSGRTRFISMTTNYKNIDIHAIWIKKFSPSQPFQTINNPSQCPCWWSRYNARYRVKVFYIFSLFDENHDLLQYAWDHRISVNSIGHLI